MEIKPVGANGTTASDNLDLILKSVEGLRLSPTSIVSSVHSYINVIYIYVYIHMYTVFDVITELFAYVIMGQKNAAITEPPPPLDHDVLVPR